ncbi:MAG: APC family permease [Candidatus Nanopelagicales bacterium]|jgi:amino acid transporter
MSELKSAPEETPATALHHSRLGVLGIVFFVVAAAAPLVGMTGAVPVAIVLGNGAAVPGAYVAVGLILLLFSFGYAAMSHQVTNTGAFFAYVGRGLGIGPGVGSAFVSLVAYLAIQLAIYGFFGALASGEFNAQFGIDLPWYAWSLIAWALVTGLSLFSVDVGAKLLGVLMGLEVLSLFIMAVAVFVVGGPEGVDVGASFAPNNILIGGLAGTAGIAFAFAFASFIGFEATAIYGEEAKDPKRTVPIATYVAILLITTLFGFVTFAVVTALGSGSVIDRVVELSSVDDVPLANPAAVVFTIAEDSVGQWLGAWAGTLVSTTMEWLVLSSLFAGLLAFQNSASRYFFSMGRAGVFPAALGRVNKFGAPLVASVTTSVITAAVIVFFWVTDKDPVLNLFYWMSGLAVVAIVFVEILVCIAILVYFRRTDVDTRVWHTMIAPILALIGLAVGEWLLMSRFGLLAGTVQEGVDPSVQAWGLNAMGWTLVLLPFAAFAVGWLVGLLRRREENEDAIQDLVS